MPARFEGTPVVEFLPDGRNVELKSELTFYDSREVRWSVPSGAVVDGASIPRVFWSIIGSPLTGRYRDASVIHDWYCDRRTRTWEETHWAFYEAMLVSGVAAAQAKVMYFGVRWGGPRWEERVIRNTTLEVGDQYRFDSYVETVRAESPNTPVSEEEQALVAKAVVKFIEQEDPPIEQLEALAERERPDQAL